MKPLTRPLLSKTAALAGLLLVAVPLAGASSTKCSKAQKGSGCNAELTIQEVRTDDNGGPCGNSAMYSIGVSVTCGECETSDNKFHRCDQSAEDISFSACGKKHTLKVDPVTQGGGWGSASSDCSRITYSVQ